MDPDDGFPVRSFSDWLTGIADYAGAPDPVSLRALFGSHGCICTLPAVTAWLAGEGEPSPEKMRQIIAALNKAIEDVDVWDDYRRFVHGDTLTRARRAPAVPSLDDLLGRSGLSVPPQEEP